MSSCFRLGASAASAPGVLMGFGFVPVPARAPSWPGLACLASAAAAGFAASLRFGAMSTTRRMK
eukprot:5384461-Prymnesium_polylepis.1